MSTFLQLFLRSFETGAIYALATLGIIIVFRTNLVINFAQGVMGMFGAYIVTIIFTKAGVPLLLAILLGVIAAIAIGFVVDFVIIRRTKKVAGSGKEIITLGMMMVFLGIAPMVFGVDPFRLPKILETGAFTLDKANLSYNSLLTQFYKPSQGRVLFRTKQGQTENLVGQKVHNIIRKGLVRTFQNVELVSELSLMDNVLVGGHIDFKSSGFSQALRLPKARREEKAMREKAERILAFMGIDHLKDALAGGQPYGIRKKVEMARTLMCDPKLIILDEPAAGLNDVETQQLAETIREVRDSYNCSILLVEHDMRLVMDICDKVCAISFGKFLACDTPENIQKNSLVQEAYLGEKED